MFSYLLNPWISGSLMVLILVLVQGKKYFGGATCKLKKNLNEQVIIITGSNRGIGREVAKELAQMGATIILACRNREKALRAIKEIKSETQNEKIEFLPLDLSDLNSVKRFAIMFKPRYQRLDMLINNAATYKADYFRTREGNEVNFCVNLLGHFLLTNLLLDLLITTPYSRVINLSSGVHQNVAPETFYIDEINDIKTFSGSWVNGQYAKTKFGLLLFTKELQRRIKQCQVKVVAVNPGSVDTELFSDFMNGSLFSIFYKCFFPFFSFFLKDENQGAQPVIYCALQNYERLVAGGYYQDCHIAEISPFAENNKVACALWDFMMNAVDLT